MRFAPLVANYGLPVEGLVPFLTQLKSDIATDNAGINDNYVCFLFISNLLNILTQPE